MKKYLVFICVFFSTISLVHAQIADFDLSGYKTPDMKIRLWEAGFNLDNNYLNRTKMNELTDFESNNNLWSAYGWYLNTRKVVRNIDVDFGTVLDFNKNRLATNNSSSKSSAIQNSFHLNFDNQFYFTNNWFVGIGFEGRGITYNSFTKALENSTLSKEINGASTYGAASIPIQFGKGRFEPIHDARLALYILEDIEKQGQLNGSVSASQINELAQLITSLKNERFFDLRHKKINEITQIDSFLKVNNLVEGCMPAYFTALYDNWEFAQQPVRYAGTLISIRLIPHFSFGTNYSYTNDLVNNILTEQSIAHQSIDSKVVIQFQKERPVSAQWQNSLALTANFGLSNSFGEIMDESRREYTNWSTSFSYAWGFYPNSRTNAGASTFLQVYKWDSLAENANNLHNTEYRANASVYANYYISPRMRLNVNLSYNFENVHSNVVSDIDYTQQRLMLNGRFSYSIF